AFCVPAIKQGQRRIGHTMDNVEEMSFEELCKELGKRISSTENALLCWKAYQAYQVEEQVGMPEGAKLSLRTRAKLVVSDEKSFRKKVAKLSGVVPATIDALLQIGKSLEKLNA